MKSRSLPKKIIANEKSCFVNKSTLTIVGDWWWEISLNAGKWRGIVEGDYLVATESAAIFFKSEIGQVIKVKLLEPEGVYDLIW